MPTKIQIARSSVPGSRPAAGSRSPGELYVNWPDNMLGVVDSANAAVDLLAVRYFSPLANYITGHYVVQAGPGCLPLRTASTCRWQVGR